MTRDEIHAHVLGALREVAPEVDAGSLPRSADLRDAADLDSMDFLRFLLGLSTRTGVEIAEPDYPKVRTLEDLEAFLLNRAPSGEPAGPSH
ncbi:MAG: acyl carrier protein [Deltaproteobacteria bacterium]|nr:acyl carrier protein [Deltaproteobacteria bacterium]